ncbi:MAG: AAA family ATPase [Acidobacteria bacterium]|nr:AAA family ATPase [Acidobacteriota bacterium]
MTKDKHPGAAPDSRRSPHHLVVGLRVTGGFLAGAHLDFADGLNCLIGGRGAGKTTALEFLRFGLGLMPDPKVHVARHKSIDSLVKANLGSGRLAIELRTRTDMRYTASRTAGESVQVLNEVGTAVPVSLDRDQIFGADVFSQNEIEDMASNPAAQLDLLDRFQEQEASSIGRELDQLHRQLEQSSSDLRRLDLEIDDLRGRASEVLAIEERLKGLVETEGPDAKRINAAHAAKSLRAREETIPAALGAALERVVRDGIALQAAFRTSIEAHLNDAVLTGPNGDLFKQYAGALEELSATLSGAVTAIGDAARGTATVLSAHGAALAERHALQEAEYRGLVAASEEQGGRAVERTALQGGLATAQAAAADQRAKEKQRSELSAARTILLNRVSELRDRRFLLRKAVAERLSRQFPSIRVSVLQAADLQGYRDMVAEALKGAGVKQGMVADRLSQAFLPGELASLVQANDRSTLIERAALDDERASKIVDALRRTGTAYAIEAVDIDDRPSIELLDGGTYKDSSQLSTGQRCTTILPILLTQSERPLLIDQPEDNLDNAFVYDTIVSALRAVKGSRQVIFVTHNPNIPVLGEAERVFVFASDGQHAAVRQVGTVDECKEEIERILEGGREAFLQRKARYGH